MRASDTVDGVSVKAYAGTTGVLLAFNVKAERRRGLLGFAVERRGGHGDPKFLNGLLHFPGAAHAPGSPVPSSVAPIQKFRWSDYTTFPATTYTYAVQPVYGTPRLPRRERGPAVTVTTASATGGEHSVLFNRAVAASQAFSRRFPDINRQLDEARRAGREATLPPEALAWLSRGLLEQITGFFARAADPSWALDVGIYELELPAIVAALTAARQRGAQVRIVYHAKRGDDQTTENETSLDGWPPELKRARVTSAIMHDKFAVLSRIEHDRRVPQAVLCGSTNFTENGVFRQGNVVHIAERPDVARQYLDLFEQLFATPGRSSATRAWIDANNPLAPRRRAMVGFSPRSGEKDLDLFVREIARAKRDVLFCTAFDLHRRIDDALLGAPHDSILRLGLENSSSEITGFHRDRTANFAATALLNSGLEGYLKETLAKQRGTLLVHTKLIVVDFTGSSPTVISGSHNLSANASRANDENYLILRGMPDVADCYGVELLRIYEHYRFRWSAKPENRAREAEGPCPRAPGTLCPDDRWTTPYFRRGSLEALDRQRFGVPAR